MPPFQKITISSRRKKILGIVALLIVCYTLAGFFLLPLAVRSLLVKQLSRALDRPVTIEKVHTNPYALSVTVRGVDIRDRDGERFLAFQSLYANLQLSSLVRWAAVIREVRLVDPHLRIVRKGDGTFNFSDLARTGDGDAASEGSRAAPPAFRIADIALTGGEVVLDDRAVDRRHELSGLTLYAPLFSTLAGEIDNDAPVEFSAVLNGAALSVSGRVRLFSPTPSVHLNVGLRELDLPPEMAYLPVQPRALLRSARGTLDAVAEYRMSGEGASRLTLYGRLALSAIDIADHAGNPLINVPKLTIVMAPSDLLSGAVHLSSVTCREPAVAIARHGTGAVNLEELLPPRGTGNEAVDDTAAEKREASAFALSVDTLRVEAGRLNFSDRAAAAPFDTSLSGLELTLSNVTLPESAPFAYSLALQTESEEVLELSGECALSDFQTGGHFRLTGLKTARYAPYYQPWVAVDVTGGTLDAAAAFHVSVGEDGTAVRISEGSLGIAALGVMDPATRDTIVSVPSLSVKGLDLDSRDRRLYVDALISQKGGLLYRRSADGKVNLASLLASPAGEAAVAPAAAEEGRPWRLTARNVLFSDWAVRYEDHQIAPSVRLDLDRIELGAEPFTTIPDERSALSMAVRWNESGRVSAKGALSLSPPAGDIALDVADVDIRSFQPYISQYLNAVVTGGRFNGGGTLDFRLDRTGSPKVTYRGDVTVAGLTTVDKAHAEDFIGFESLYLSGVETGVNPPRFIADKMALSSYRTSVVVLPDGTVNWGKLIAKKAPSAPESAPGGDGAADAAPAKVAVRQITIEDGTIAFTDRLNKPNFRVDIQNLGGHITGLSSNEGAMAEVFLKGAGGNSAPIEISGRLHPFGGERSGAVKLTFKNVDLSPFSTYSGKYAGYLIRKGKLLLGLEYELDGKKLKGKNLVVLDQLTLGERVESPHATSLPVAFAISLLKDRSGRITLDLPVSGDLGDPKFKIGSVILRMVVNLFTKIATSPFAVLGAVFGGGEELSRVDFDPGDDQVLESGRNTIATLAKALYERPALQLEVRGEVDPRADTEALRQRRFDSLLKAEKLKQMTRTGQAAVPLEEIRIDPAERESLLDSAYSAAQFAKPRDASGNIKSLAPEEIEKLLITTIPVTPDDLRLLAYERASNVRDLLLAADGSDPSRVFVVEPQTDFNPESGDHHHSRVNFTLK